eukprot:2633956-Rhodomonas_salina.4
MPGLGALLLGKGGSARARDTGPGAGWSRVCSDAAVPDSEVSESASARVSLAGKVVISPRGSVTVRSSPSEPGSSHGHSQGIRVMLTMPFDSETR